ncbi:MAG: glycosyltransferase family 2 protein [Planctomycetes bacterium]|nr:glycosyltransferase family 2 protein [Planctomycetota bacterium]
MPRSDEGREASLSSASVSCDLSVVVVNWNLRALVLEAIQSAFDTIQSHSFEVIVVDNASGDGSAEAVRDRFPKVHLIQNAENRGFGCANNQAFAIARGRHLLLLNSDARLLPGAADTLADFLDAHPDVGICGGQLLNPDGTPQNSFDNFPTLATELTNKAVLRRLFPARYPSRLQPGIEIRDVEVVIGALMLVRADLAGRLGGFDPGYFLFLEETDLCYRARLEGFRVCQVTAARAVHHQGRSSVRRLPGLSRIEYYRAKYRFFRKWSPGPRYAFLRAGAFLKLFPNLLLNLLAGLFTLFLIPRVRERIGIYASLVAWHLRGCPDHPSLRHAGGHAKERR